MARVEVPPDLPWDFREPPEDPARRLQCIAERRLIERALRRAGGNQSKAARLLQISRNGLAKRMKRLGIRADGSQEG